MSTIYTIIVVSCAILIVNAAQSLPEVTLASGVVIGTTTSIAFATATVNQYLGIPFAAPPERFALPTPPPAWEEPLRAFARSPACIQQINYPIAKRLFTSLFFNNPAPEESEDCLYLNIFTPSTPPPPGGYAVLFWIFGGSLELGNAGQPQYDGSHFAAFEDVIIVAANYRTNVFGFPSSPEIPLTQRNLGFLDQRFALQWVQENIGTFGGDPKKVTVFGESAGATSTDALVTSWPNDPPFRAAILESGESSVPLVTNVGINSTNSWFNLTSALGCSDSTSNLTCVRAASAMEIKRILEYAALKFRPVFDGITLIHNAAEARAAHAIANVPIMAGTNGQEGRVFVYGQTNLTVVLGSIPGMTPDLEAAITEAYPIGSFGTRNEFELIAQVGTDVLLGCPMAILVNQSAAAGYPTWRYWYNATFPNQQVFPDLGAYHSAEIVQVFSTYTAFFTLQQVELSNYMRRAWARFAKDPWRGPGWNAIGSSGVDLGALGTNGTSGVIEISRNVVDANCHLFDALYAAAATAPVV